MSEDPKISAVVPTFNRQATIERAIDSILAQEFQPSEIIVIDDGSTDGTRKLLEQYKLKIRYVYQANAGVASARNLGVQSARNEWIAFLDSDDIWLPTHLKKIADAIRATSGRAAIYFSDLETSVQHHAVRHWDRCGLKVNAAHELKDDGTAWVLMPIQPLMLQASVINRARYLECGGLPGRMRVREDTLLFYKLGLLYPICAVSGRGILQMDDATVRLTRELDSSTIRYSIDTITMYKEVLEICKIRRPELRRRVGEELSSAYFGAGRAFYRQRFYRQALRNLLMSAVTSVKACAECSWQTLVRFIFRQKPVTSPTSLARM